MHITSYNNGLKHSYNDLPAAIYPDGTKCWYKNGKLHRDNDQPAVISANGKIEYWIHGIKLSSTNWIAEGF